MRFGQDALAGVTTTGTRYVVEHSQAATHVFTTEANQLIPATILSVSQSTVWEMPALRVEFEDAVGQGILRAPLEDSQGPFVQFGLELMGPQGTYEPGADEGERLDWIHPLAVSDGVLGAGRAADGTVFLVDTAGGKLRLYYSDGGTLLRTRLYGLDWPAGSTAQDGTLRVGFGASPGYAFLLVQFNQGNVSFRLQETGRVELEVATPDPSEPSGYLTRVLLPSSFGTAIELGQDLALEMVALSELETLSMCEQEEPLDF